MNADGARKLIEAVKPRTAFLQHFGITMLNGVAEREAKWIARETGVETRAARDGLEFELGGSAKEKGQTGVNSFVSR